MVTLTADIFSPRWGHTDRYEFELSEDEMRISHPPRKTKCVWRDNKDPEWKGDTLESILRNDSIYPPSILPRLLEHLWGSWKDGELDDAQAQQELDGLVVWLNQITKNKPASEFWRAYF